MKGTKTVTLELDNGDVEELRMLLCLALHVMWYCARHEKLPHEFYGPSGTYCSAHELKRGIEFAEALQEAL